MQERDETAVNLLLGILFYQVGKLLLNSFVGGFNLGAMVFVVFSAFVLVKGVPKYGNYLVGAGLGLIALYYLPGNVSNLLHGSLVYALYLLEALGDCGCAFLLLTHKGIRERFCGTGQD